MTPRQRVIASLEHRQPDKTPYDIDFTQPAKKRMAEFYGDPDFEAGLGGALKVLSAAPRGSWRDVGNEVIEDRFGVRWDRSIDKDIGTVCNTPVTKDNVKSYPFPKAGAPDSWEGWPKGSVQDGEHFIMASLGFSLFERAWTMAGMETVLMAMADDHAFLNALLDRILEFNLEVIRAACTRDIDAMRFGDDWGQQRGVIMGPALWREFIKPRVRQMYGAVKAAGKKVFIHSCGKVDDLFPDLIECGLDAFNPFQPEVMDVFEMKRKHGDRLSFHGGISTQKTLPFGTVAQVKDEVRRLIERVGKDGGLIAAPAHSIPKDAKPENIAAMIEVLCNQ